MKKNLTDARALCKKYAEEAEEIRLKQECIAEKADKEEREYTDDEMSEMKKLKVKADLIDSHYRKAELDVQRIEMETRKEQYRSENPVKKMPTLNELILRCVDGTMTDDDKAIDARGRAMMAGTGVSIRKNGAICLPVESRSQNATGTANLGGNTIEDTRMPMMMPLLDDLVLSKLGVTTMTGLSNNVKFPKGTAAAAFWEGEEDTAGATGVTFENITFSPKRVAAQMIVTRQLLEQSSEDIQGYLTDALRDAFNQLIQKTLLSADASTTTKPAGIFYSATALDSVSLDWEDVIGFKTSLKKANAFVGNPKWLISPDLYGKGETTLKAAGVSGYLIQDGKLAGYEVIDSNAVPIDLGTASDESGVVLADWSKYFFGTWGAVTLMVDPYTKAAEDSYRIIINGYVDGGKLRDESFVIKTAPIA